jgi:hypothetical protein
MTYKLSGTKHMLKDMGSYKMIFLIYDGFSDKTILKQSVFGSLTGSL